MDEVDRIGAEDITFVETLGEAAVFVAQTVDPSRTSLSSQKPVDGFLFSLFVVNMLDLVLEDFIGLDILKGLLASSGSEILALLQA